MRNESRTTGWPLRTRGHRERKILLILWLALSTPLAAQTCDSAPVAVDDEVYHDGLLLVIDVLANDDEPDGEALTVTSVSTTCDGTVNEAFGLVSLAPTTPTPEACTIAYQIEDEQANQANATVFVHLPDLVFQDGFESGDTSAWGGS